MFAPALEAGELAAADALLNAASQSRCQSPGRLTIGHSPLLGAKQMNTLLGNRSWPAPQADIVFIEANLADLIRRVDEGTVDLAVVPSGFKRTCHESLPLAKEALFYLPSRQAAPRRAERVRVADIARETFVMMPDSCGLAHATRRLFRKTALRTYAGEAMSYALLEEWTDLGLGSAILPESRLRDRQRAVPLVDAHARPVQIEYEALWLRVTRRAPLKALVGALRAASRR